MLLQDCRLALRNLLKERGVFLTAVASLAVGIAANTTIFSLVQAVEFPRLIYPEASRIVLIESHNAARGLPSLPVSAPDAIDLTATTHTLSSLAMTADRESTLREAFTPARWSGREAPAKFFSVLGVPAAKGRVLNDQDGAAIIFSDHLWRSQFAADAAIVGRVIHLDNEPRTITGVMPARFDSDADFWILPPRNATAPAREDRRLTVFAKLAGGVSLAAAASELRGIASRLASRYPATNSGWTMYPRPIARLHGQDSRSLLWLLQGAVALVLLLACVNIANILLARGSRRMQEMAIRAALGASRGALLRQLLIESLLLSMAGCLLGLFLTPWGIDFALATGAAPAAIEPSLNLLVLGFTAFVTMLTGVFCGIVPALRASHVSPGAALGGVRSGGEPRGHVRLRAGLVALQIACATVLASSAGLMLETLANRERVDLGFQPHGAVRADLTLPANGNNASRLLASLNHHPDIECAAVHAWAFSRGAGTSMQIDRPGAPHAAESVSPAYFEAMGIPIRQGRVFSDADRSDGARVAVVNEEFARLAWPDRSPVGETLRVNQSLAVTIVGVVGSIRASSMHEAKASRIYLSYDQFPNAEIELVVRARTSVARTVQATQTTVRNADANLVLDKLRTLDDDVARYLAPVRSLTILYSAFGLAGFLLAALGVFGAISYNVSQRRREMAVRAALGAGPLDIFLLVVKRALLIAAAGVVPGVFAASLAARSLRSFLFGVTPVNPPALVFAGIFLAIISLIACYAPARAAASADPMTALRLD